MLEFGENILSCSNRGTDSVTCVSSSNGYRCNCRKNFYGTFCEMEHECVRKVSGIIWFREARVEKIKKLESTRRSNVRLSVEIIEDKV